MIDQLQQKVEEIDCKPVAETQDVEIFDNVNEKITDGKFGVSDPELFLIFKCFKVYPYGANEITLKRVGENDYKVSGTISLHINDRFDFHDTDPQYAYECQQAGCVHNFDIDVYGVDFEINDLDVNLDSSKMYCEGDADEKKCCLDGCCSGECCPEGTPNAGICYDSSNPEDGCCQYKVNDEVKCYEGNYPPDKCTTCYGGSWHSGWWCEDSECVPEASTFVLFATGLLCLAGYIGLRRKEK